MAEFSMIQLWDDTRRFVLRELALLLPLGFATFGLATLIVSLVAPQHQDAAATSLEPWMLWMIPAAALMLIGYLATSRIVLQPGISVAEAIDGAVLLQPRAIGMLLLLVAAMTVVILLTALVTGLLANMLGLNQVGAVTMMVVALLPPLLWISVRLAVLWPVLADRGEGVRDTLGPAMGLTRGHMIMIATLIFVTGMMYIVMTAVVELAGGPGLLLIARLLSSPQTGPVLVSILMAAFNAVYLVFWSVMLTSLYRHLARR